MGWVGTAVSLAMTGIGLISSLFSRNTLSQTDPIITGVKLTTSAYGLTRPVLYGVNRLTGNMIWYGDFQAFSQTSGVSAGGKGGSQKYESTSWYYSCSFALGLTEGEISYIVKGWAGDTQLDLYPTGQSDKILAQLFSTGWTVKTGTADQAVWSYLLSKVPIQAIKYPNLAYVAASNYGLGTSGNLPNFGFVVEGLENYYADTATIQETHEIDTTVTVRKANWYLSTNEVAWAGTTLNLSAGLLNIVDADTFTIAAKCDTLLVPGLGMTITFLDDSYATGFIDSSSYDEGTNTTTITMTSEMFGELPIKSLVVDVGPYIMVEVESSPGAGEYSVSDGVYTFSGIETGDVYIDYDYLVTVGANPADIISDIVTNGFYGLGMSGGVIDSSVDDYAEYCRANEFFLSPLFTSQAQAKDVISLLLRLTNTEIVWGDNKIIFVPLGDSIVTSDYGSWAPGLTPACQITYDDLDDDGEDSLQVMRSTARDSCNHVAINHVNKDNEYNPEVTEYQDQGDIVTNGKRSLGSITANGIITKTLALKIGRMLCKRSMLVRNKFSFSLPLNFIYLRPLDVVGLTSAYHGLVQIPVRILNMRISEANIRVEAEDLGIGSATVPTADTDGSLDNYVPNKLVYPGDANDPIIFVPPLSLAEYEVWLATAGGGNWGGCHVWVSQDGATYRRVGTMIGPSRYGELTADLPSIAASPDETNTLSVDMSASGGELTGGTEVEADALRNLVVVDSEYLSFADATLTGTDEYDLEYLVRGVYGSGMTFHATGAPFVRLDDNVFKYPIAATDIGQTMYVKLQSFNVFGNALQDLSTLTAHEYVVESPGSDVGIGATNLFIKNNDTTPESIVDVAFDACDLTSSAGHVWSVGPLGFEIDLLASGLNGLDTGAVAADTWYYLFAVANIVQETVGGLASLSATSPTMPTAYTHKQIVGAVRTDGSGNLLLFNQIGYELLYEEQQEVASRTTDAGYFDRTYFDHDYFNPEYFNFGAAQEWDDLSLSDRVPPVATRALISLTGTAGAAELALAARKNGSTSNGQIATMVSAGASGSVSGWVDTDLNQRVDLSITPAPAAWWVYVNGFRFNV